MLLVLLIVLLVLFLVGGAFVHWLWIIALVALIVLIVRALVYPRGRI